MRVLVTGGAGLLGRALLADAPEALEVHVTARRTRVADDVPSHHLDLADAPAVSMVLQHVRPRVVVHTAYGREHGERDIVQASSNVAEACVATDVSLVHISSDVVFDGEHAPYAEDDPLSPVSEYGHHKAQAELNVSEVVPDVAVVRTSLLTSVDPLDPRSAWVAEALRGGRELRLFTDETRCPIAVEDLAAQIWELVGLPVDQRAGPWHLVGPEAISRYDLGRLVAAHQGLDPAGLVPARSDEQPEPRPRDLRLSTARADRLLATTARPVSELFGVAAGG